jgi:glyoxylase-like metal-dependent hydrolase (beta-lactamase superfamily II)
MSIKPVFVLDRSGWTILADDGDPSGKQADPGEILERWQRSETLLSLKTRRDLELLALGRTPRDTEIDPHESEPLPGFRVLALRSPTLPPAKHTNAYVLGRERLVVVDPATYEQDERDKLLDHLERLTDRGARIEAIVLTHHHGDHIGAAAWLSDKIGAPIAAHRITGELTGARASVTRFLDEGDIIDLGGDFQLGILHTPGHAPGHIVLRDLRPHGRAMIAGDMIAGIGTIIIDPPEGDMAVYLAQLGRMRALPNAVLFPAHGEPQVDGHAKLDHYVAHRLKREKKVYAALLEHRGEATPFDLLPRAYDDTPALLFPLAARSCLAHLLKLAKDGRVAEQGEKFRAN